MPVGIRNMWSKWSLLISQLVCKFPAIWSYLILTHIKGNLRQTHVDVLLMTSRNQRFTFPHFVGCFYVLGFDTQKQLRNKRYDIRVQHSTLISIYKEQECSRSRQMVGTPPLDIHTHTCLSKGHGLSHPYPPTKDKLCCFFLQFVPGHPVVWCSTWRGQGWDVDR